MEQAIARQPLILVLMAFCTMLMLVPALHAARLGDWFVLRTFLYHSIFFAILTVMLGLGMARQSRSKSASRHLLTLLQAYLILPVMLSMPLNHLVPTITWSQAYFEMLSCLTTTGATLFRDPGALPDAVHTWRATVGWAGGLIILVAALAILEPMKLGGFEIQASLDSSSPSQRRAMGGSGVGNERVIRLARVILLPYTGLTFLLMLGLLTAGDRAFVALNHAMSVLATSGITPLQNLEQSNSGRIGEVLVFLFLLVAINHRLLNSEYRIKMFLSRKLDPEFKIALACLIIIPTMLLLRHFFAALDIAEQENFGAAIRAFWGGMFNVLSFLTTTGFESADWDDARNWSGLGAPGLILLALCLMGGGIATTAGGVKLLRVYALYKHGRREMGRLIYPHSVGGSGISARQIRREGARVAWIFLMLFMVGIAVCMLALTAVGQGFDSAMTLSIASLTNTGPAALLLGTRIDYMAMDYVTRAILCIAMIIGRMEALVVIALLSSGFWRQ